MKTRPITPYERLAQEARECLAGVIYPHRKTMWIYSKEEIQKAQYVIGSQLYERVAAANQLGYEVHLVPKDGALEVQYVKRRPTWEEIPWNLRK